MADLSGAGGARIVKVKQDYAANANVPGVLMPYTADWFDMAPSGTQMGAQVCIEKNGIPMVTGETAGVDVDIVPGEDPSKGDIRFVQGLNAGDVLAVRYCLTRLLTLP